MEIKFTNTWETSKCWVNRACGILPLGMCDIEEDTIYVFLDSILWASEFTSDTPEEWVAEAISKVIIHELMHALEPDLSEEKIEWAENVVYRLLEEENL
ncbi:MAG: hypothetical protein OH337_04020 [Candidatus Parvarchaeota archaeon]|nr:hypothetical protein [Candidatus Haiyanarchaeum thermophilum]